MNHTKKMPLCVLNHTYLTLDQTKTIAGSKMNLNGLLESLFWVFEKKLSIVVRGKALPHGWFTYRTCVCYHWRSALSFSGSNPSFVKRPKTMESFGQVPNKCANAQP